MTFTTTSDLMRHLRKERVALGISLRSMAKKLDVSPAALSRLENCKYKFEHYEALESYAKALGLVITLAMEVRSHAKDEAPMPCLPQVSEPATTP